MYKSKATTTTTLKANIDSRQGGDNSNKCQQQLTGTKATTFKANNNTIDNTKSKQQQQQTRGRQGEAIERRRKQSSARVPFTFHFPLFGLKWSL